MFDKLDEECTETVEKVKLAKMTSAEQENKHKCNSWTLYIVLLLIIFTISVGIGAFFSFELVLENVLLVLSLVLVLKQQFNYQTFK